MNYIQQLKDENIALQCRLNTAYKAIEEFNTFLLSSKFTGIEANGTGAGDRRDWIATGDVLRIMNDIQTELRD